MNSSLSQAGDDIILAKLREACSDPKLQAKLCDATGWSDSMPNKIKNGDTGIVITKLAAVLHALGLVVTTTEYMDYLAQGNVIGSNCRCARMSMGQCGKGCG